MLALLYLAVTTFRNWIDHSGPVPRRLAKLSYGVYIVHAPVLGLVAIPLVGTGIPGLLKYAIATGVTWVTSNLIVWGYRMIVARRRGVTA
jgi:peptidoglycan/LPS O-acetylase OafA/YrhL